jgi:hypothetical protein
VPKSPSIQEPKGTRAQGSELFGRPSPSPRTSLKSADSDFETTLDSDSACLFVYAFIL